MTRVGALWIGGLEPYMDEKFLTNAMMVLGQEGVVSIKVMTNKFTGEPAGYGFINFESDQRAIVTMHRLGGKVIPNSNPPIRFKLNHNSTRLLPGEPDTSIWVGDLTPEVDDYALFQFFSQRYQTIRCSKVVLDEAGFSKGYGFVRFGADQEQQHALAHMTGEHGLGSKPIKVSMANQKNRVAVSQNGGGGPLHRHQNHQNSVGGGAGAGFTAGWPGHLDSPDGGSGNWPPSQHAWVPPSQGSYGGGGGGGGGGGSGGGGTVGNGGAAAAAPPQPDYGAYQYYQQYAQPMSQQQQQFMAAAALSAWQQQQQQPQNQQ